MKKIRPLGNRVLIQRAKAPTTKGGILLPETTHEKQKEGVVIAIGPGKSDEQGNKEPMQLKVGDKVLFSSYAGTEVKGDNEELIIMTEDDVLGVMP